MTSTNVTTSNQYLEKQNLIQILIRYVYFRDHNVTMELEKARLVLVK